ncbi:MAG: ABC transporter permease [Candidatus Hodarchaeota archaeon]
MSQAILIFDELRGFYKSKIMVILWIGMPLLAFIVHFLGGVESFGVPMSYLTAMLVSSISGTLGSVSLSTSITNEKNRHVYDMFLIRPVQRWEILFSKYIAVYACLLLAIALSVLVGLVIDTITIGSIPVMLLVKTAESIGTCVVGTALACAIGMFFGVMMSSVQAAALLSIFVGNQITTFTAFFSIIPASMAAEFSPLFFSYITCIGIAALFLVITLTKFNKLQF